MIQAGDKAPSVSGAAYDGVTIDLGAPGKATVLYFYPNLPQGLHLGLNDGSC